MPKVTLDKPGVAYRIFNDWLRGEMARRKIKQSELAKYLGLSQPGLSTRITGKTPWLFKEVLDVLDFMGVSFEDVL